MAASPGLALALAALASLHAGCSFAFTDTLPDGHAGMQYFDCTNNAGLAVADGVFALSSAISGAVALSQSKAEFAAENDDADRNLVAGANIGMAAVFAASGIYGIIHSERCGDAKRVLRQRFGNAAEPGVAAPPPLPVERTRRPLPGAQPIAPPPAPPATPPTAPTTLPPADAPPPAPPPPAPAEATTPPPAPPPAQ